MTDSCDGTKGKTAKIRDSVGRLAALAGVPLAAVRDVKASDPKRIRTDGGRSGELVIGLPERTTDLVDAAQRRAPTGSEVVDVNETLGFVVIRLPKGADSMSTAGSIGNRDDVRYAEENRTKSADFDPTSVRPVEIEYESSSSTAAEDAVTEDAVIPSDPRYVSQYAPQQVNAPAAWEETTGSSSVTIAVCDTGTKYDHADLAANMDDSVSNHGHDYVDGDADPYPDSFLAGGGAEGHGTHVSGIAGAVTNNGVGIAGVSDCSLLAVRVLDEGGTGWDSDIASGIQWATDNGADVINLSLGGDGLSSVIGDAVEYAYDQGVFITASAGNDGVEKSNVGPAAHPECVAVSAVDENEDLWSGSNWGDYVEITAPGKNVLSLWPANFDEDGPNDYYAHSSGTSMSAPVVAGVAGLVLSANPNLSNTEVRNILKNTATDIGLTDKEQGAGQVDAHAAVLEALGTPLDELTEKWPQTHVTDGRSQFATAAVDDDHVYVGGLGETFYALSRDDGTVAWSVLRDGSLSDSSAHVDGGRVFVGSGGGVLYAFDATDGSEVWTHSTDSAITASPTVLGTTVFVAANDGTVHARDVADGSEVWTQGVGSPVYSTVAGADGLVFVTTADGRIVALDAATGVGSWIETIGADLGSSSPAVHDGTVYVAADRVYARDAATGSPKWDVAYGGTAGSSPAYSDGRVFVGSADGRVYALDDENGGSVAWTYDTGSAIAASPAVVAERVVVASLDGTLYVLDAGSGSVVDTATVPGQTRSSPVVVDDEVYVGSENGSFVSFE